MNNDTTVMITLGNRAALEIDKYGDLLITQGEYETIHLGKATKHNIEGIIECLNRMKVHAE